MNLLMAATKRDRYGSAGSTMILVGYRRRGLRAAELTDVRCDQVDFTTITLHSRPVSEFAILSRSRRGPAKAILRNYIVNR